VNTIQWYAVHTKPRAEIQAQNALAHRGLAVYLPLIRVKRVNPRARRHAPLFPGYLFVRADLEQVGESAINWAQGVLSLVHFGGVPAAVPEAIIVHIKQRLEELEQRDGEVVPFRHGESVRISTGPLRDLDVVFDQPLTAKGRARVLLQFMGRIAAAEVRLESLERRNSPPQSFGS
jgi:transcriptional antiterminator RfaH